MTREEAQRLLDENLKNGNLIKHSLAVQAIMRGLAEKLGEDADRFGLAGLLHDIDYEFTAKEPDKHSKIGAEMLEKAGFDGEIVHAVLTHNDRHGIARESVMDKALFCADPVSGLITAAALIRPEKKLEVVTVEFLKKKFSDKAFAKGANRETMLACADLNLTLDELFEVALPSMQSISEALGL
jgi:putative nucleotidyltransferase with HDIG domain